MKKLFYILCISIVIVGLSACSNSASQDPASDLQSEKWNVVATNGESYTAEFNKDTVSFKMGSFTRGFSYSIDEDEISLIEDGEDPVIFELTKEDDEYNFKATTEDIKEVFGDLTLSPSKE